MLTPLPKRKPWEVASQAATLDRLSGGRVILSVGLGAPEPRFYMFEDDPGRKVRAEMLDEGLEMLALMYRGEPFELPGQALPRAPARHDGAAAVAPAAARSDLGGRAVAGAGVDATLGALGRVAAQLPHARRGEPASRRPRCWPRRWPG